MDIERVETGEIFYAFNRDMHTPKIKYHLCINDKCYFIINTKPHTYDLKITPKDCSLLEYDCYVKCDQLFTESINNFNIIKKEELSTNALKSIISKAKMSPTLTGIQIKNIVSLLEECIKLRETKVIS